MAAYYNENEPYAAQWIRNLIGGGLLAPGDVDDRSIVDVQPDDVAGYSQCHFFAGIGGWSYSLRLAGWPDDRPVWTGSCPCQPFSVAGRKKGFEDSRHLWPFWRGLIAERRPAAVLGEQVADATEWIALVHGDLEAMDYAVGCVPIEAASAGADHLRDRYWFVAHNDSQPGQQIARRASGDETADGRARWLARQPDSDHGHSGDGESAGVGALADGDGERSQEPVGQSSDLGPERAPPAGTGLRLLADARSVGWGEGWTEHELRRWGPTAAVCRIDDRQLIECPDGKWRRLPPPRVRWLGTRLPARIPRIRAFGNAIDPRPATEFIKAFMNCQP